MSFNSSLKLDINTSCWIMTKSKLTTNFYVAMCTVVILSVLCYHSTVNFNTRDNYTTQDLEINLS
jgi:hypothetical protein